MAPSIHTILRLLLAIVAVSMLLLAINVTWMLANSSESHSGVLHAVLLTWIFTLLYGGVCGLIAAFKNRAVLTAHVAVCWLLVAGLHIWYIVKGRHQLLHLPQSSSWTLLIKISADVLCVTSIVVAALLIHWNRALLSAGGIMLHAVIPIARQDSIV